MSASRSTFSIRLEWLAWHPWLGALIFATLQGGLRVAGYRGRHEPRAAFGTVSMDEFVTAFASTFVVVALVLILVKGVLLFLRRGRPEAKR